MVRFSPDPAAPEVEIQWFFVDDLPGTLPLGMYTRFASGNWANEHTCPAAWTGPGEVSPFPTDRPWVRGGRLVDAVCSGQPIGSPSQFAGNIAWPWVPLPANACCLPRAQAAAPRFRWGFAANVASATCPYCPDPLGPDLYVRIALGRPSTFQIPDTSPLWGDFVFHRRINPCEYWSDVITVVTTSGPYDFRYILNFQPGGPIGIEVNACAPDGSNLPGDLIEWNSNLLLNCCGPHGVPFWQDTGVFQGVRNDATGSPALVSSCHPLPPPNPLPSVASFKWSFAPLIVPATRTTFSYKWSFGSKAVPQLPLSFNFKWNFRADTMPYPTGDPCSNLSVPTPLAFVWDGPGWSGGPAGTCDLVLATRVILGQDPGNPCRWTATGGPFDFGSGPENWYYELLLYGPNQVSFNVTSDFGSIESYWGTNLWDGSLPIVIPMDAEFSSVCTLNSFTDSIVYPSPT